MLCTKCQEEVKPVVAIDIDGTMGRYHEHFLMFAEAYLNKEAPWDFDSSMPFKKWFSLRYGVTDDVWHDVKLAYRQGGMKRSMLRYVWSRELCQAIRGAGAELWVTTTRPYIRHDNIDPDTREWLRRNQIYYDYLLYDGHKYDKLVDLVGTDRIVAILDDLVEELKEADRHGLQRATILRRNSFNGAMIFPSVVEDLELAQRQILTRIKKWEEQYAHVS